MNRLEHRRRSRRRQRIGVAFLGVAALGGGLALGVLRSDEPAPAGSPTATTTSEPILSPHRATLLSVASADSSRVLAIPPLLIAEPVDGGDSRALLLDSALRGIGPAGEVPLRQHASGFGPEGLAGAIRNELGLRIDVTAEITEVQLATILEAVGPLEIPLAAAIREGGETVYEAGEQQMDAAELVTFLAFPFADDAIDAPTRLAMLSAAWEAIATAPGTGRAVRTAGLPADATEALRALSTVTAVEPIPVTELDEAVILDRVAYDTISPRLEPIWLAGVPPAERPVVDISGRGLVEPLLLLISDGIRIARITDTAVKRTSIETDDAELGRRLRQLLDADGFDAPGDPLRTGLDARIAYRRGA